MNPPERDEDHPEGNLIGIQNEDITVYMAHLMKGSLLVKEGEGVKEGQPVARVGNTGDTSKPHLHIHAERGVKEGEISGGEGVPILFDERFLVRNSIVDRRQ